MKFQSLVLGILFVSFNSFGAELFSQPQTFVDEEAFIEKELERLSLKQKIGQLFLIGVNGVEFGSVNEKKIKELQPGGVIFFGRNIKSASQLSTFIYSMQKFALDNNIPPLFTAVDQEGGSVTRLKHWPPIPSAAAVGRASDFDLAYKMALFTGQILKTLGFNMNLAPVLDLSDPLEKSFIGSRAYSDDPQTVTRLGATIITGYEAAGVISIAKHFPGHGSSVGDSHLETPLVNYSLEHLLSADAIPFQKLSLAKRLPGVMVAHLSFPKIEKSGLPVTYSKVFLKTLLRGEFGYQGLVLTDDLEMLGARGISDAGQRALKALQAGADLIMVAWNPASQKKAIDTIYGAVAQGDLSEERINQSVRRILKTKNAFHLFETKPSPPNKQELEVMVYHRELQSVIDKIVIKNLELSASSGMRPFSEKDQELLLVSSDLRFSSSFQSAFSNRRVRLFQVDQYTTAQHLHEELQRYPKHYSIVYYASTPSSIKLLSSLSKVDRARLFVITPELPYRFRAAADFKGVFYSYTRHPNLGSLFYSMISRSDTLRSPAGATEKGSTNGRQDN